MAGAQVVYVAVDDQGRAQLRTAQRVIHDFGSIPLTEPDDECCSSSYGASVSASPTHVAGTWESFVTVKGAVASAFSSTVAGRLDGPVEPLSSCSPFGIPPSRSADVDGTRVAYTTEECNSGADHRIVVRDLAANSDVATLPAPAGKRLSRVQLAGRFLAWVEAEPVAGSGDLVVYDLTAGAESYRVPGVGLYSLQSDGKVVRIAPQPGAPDECSGQLAWHAPGEPESHLLGGCPRGAPVAAGDRVLYLDADSADLQIVSLTGASPAQTVVDSTAPGVVQSIDFDGSRAAYTVAGCLPQLGQVYVDDLNGPAAVEGAECPFAVSRSRVRASRSGPPRSGRRARGAATPPSTSAGAGGRRPGPSRP